MDDTRSVSEVQEALGRMRVDPSCSVHIGTAKGHGAGEVVESPSPIDGLPLSRLRWATHEDVDRAAEAARAAFLKLRTLPAPRRGELLRRFAQVLREHREDLSVLVTWEAGKIRSESVGEVQEMIDICDFSVGLSRQLYGQTMTSERVSHRLTEQWHPLGPVAVITAFNFPVAVWAWNAAVAIVCGDPVVWKPSEKTPLCALACHQLLMQAAREMGDVPPEVSSVVVGGVDVGQALAASSRFPLVSATGSVHMGRRVAEAVSKRLGRSLLELGGNNAAIVTPSADLDLAVRAMVFAAAGTAGQRCTTLRRLIVHRSRYDEVLEALRAVYERLPVGDPREEGTLVGPLVDERAYVAMQCALEQARAEGGIVHLGDRVTDGVPEGGFYVRPALVEMRSQSAIVTEETFAPILYAMAYDEFDEAVALHNAVPQGLSSAIFTNDVREAERFCGPAGSDCGIANVNVGTSGAEIGGAFGGEKDTGGGRESGSDSWKAYMRRATNTVNYSDELPLAQGVKFDVDA